MLISFTAALAASSTLLGLSFGSNKVFSHMIPGLPFCIPSGDLHLFYAFWIPLLIAESFLCGLAVYRGVYLHRLYGRTFQSGNQLVEFLIRDSVVYFLIIFAIYIANTIVFIFAGEPIWRCIDVFSVVLSYVLGTRLLMNMRNTAGSSDESKPSVQFSEYPPSLPYLHINSRMTTTDSQPSSSRLADTALTEDLRPEGHHKAQVPNTWSPGGCSTAVPGCGVVEVMV